jgi:long-chain acyl-CoA synthetase
VIVLSGGKKASPQPLENELKQSPYIETPIVLGDRLKFLVALIVPDVDRIRTALPGVALDLHRLDATPEVRQLVQKEIDVYNSRHPHHEQIRAFAMLPDTLTIENGTMTPTLKVKRRVIEQRYHDLIEALYRDRAADTIGL